MQETQQQAKAREVEWADEEKQLHLQGFRWGPNYELELMRGISIKVSLRMFR